MKSLVVSSLLIGLLAQPSQAEEKSGDTLSSGVLLSLHEKFETAANEVYLEDVADCSGAESVCEVLGGIRILQSLAPGIATQVSQPALREIILTEVADISLQFAGNEFVTVVPAVHQITQVEIESHLRSRLDEIAQGWHSMRFVIKRLRLFEPISSRDAEYQVVVPTLDGGIEDAIRAISESVGGWFIVEARIQDQDWSQTFKLHVQIDVEMSAPVASRDLDRGEILQATDISARWLKMNRFNMSDVTTTSDLIGKVLSRRVVSGEPLKKAFAKKPVVIGRGKMIKVRLNQAGIALSSEAKALQAGGVGDEIEVQVVPTKKKLIARIVDADNVEGKM